MLYYAGDLAAFCSKYYQLPDSSTLSHIQILVQSVSYNFKISVQYHWQMYTYPAGPLHPGREDGELKTMVMRVRKSSTVGCEYESYAELPQTGVCQAS